MARGRGRPATAKRGRPRTVAPPSPPAGDVPAPESPPAKRRRSGRPSRLVAAAEEEEKLRQKQEEAQVEAEIEHQLEQLQQQVLDQASSSSSCNDEAVAMRPNPVKRKSSGGRPTKKMLEEQEEPDEDGLMPAQLPIMDEEQSCGLHMTTMQIRALSNLVSCKDCGESVTLSVRPTTKGMISEFVVTCTVCEAKKVTITPNLVRERKRKREIKGLVLQKTENINYAHVAAFLDNGLGYSGLRHYCKYFNARCLNEATFIVYARQVIQDVVNDTEDNLQSNARIVRKVYDAGLDEILDITVSFTTTYHQWGSDFCLVAGAVIELQTGLVLDYDVANMYCHVCKINAKRIISMTPTEMTDWFNKHQASCEIREWCDELDHDAEEGVKDIEPKYLECFVAKKIWSRSVEKFGFRYSTLIHESDETIHNELLRSAPYGDTLVMIDNLTNCFSRRKSEHARTAFQNKLKSKCPRERVQTKDRIMYVYAMSIPEYNRFAVGSNIKLRELVRRMEIEEAETEGFTLQVLDTLPTIQAHEVIPADGETAEIIYTHEDEELYDIQGEIGEEEGEEGEEEEEVEGEEEMGEEEEMETQQIPSKSSGKKIEPVIKRENIILEAMEESGGFEQQSSENQDVEDQPPSSSKESGKSSDGSSKTSGAGVVTTISSRNDPSQQIIVVTATKASAAAAKAAAATTSATSRGQQQTNGESSSSEMSVKASSNQLSVPSTSAASSNSQDASATSSTTDSNGIDTQAGSS